MGSKMVVVVMVLWSIVYQSTVVAWLGGSTLVSINK